MKVWASASSQLSSFQLRMSGWWVPGVSRWYHQGWIYLATAIVVVVSWILIQVVLKITKSHISCKSMNEEFLTPLQGSRGSPVFFFVFVAFKAVKPSSRLLLIPTPWILYWVRLRGQECVARTTDIKGLLNCWRIIKNHQQLIPLQIQDRSLWGKPLKSHLQNVVLSPMTWGSRVLGTLSVYLQHRGALEVLRMMDPC